MCSYVLAGPACLAADFAGMFRSFAGISRAEAAFTAALGLALAGCAFEAYNEIEVDADAPSCIKMASMGGTEITFVDK